jgi:hypothetical protein
MTTQVSVEVPAGANYQVEFDLSTMDPDGTVVVITTHYVQPGETFSTYIYGTRHVSRIIEMPLTT